MYYEVSVYDKNKLMKMVFFQYSDSEDDSADDETQPTKTSKKFARSPRCLTRGKYLNNIPLKRRLYALCKCLMDYTVRIP